MNQVTAFDKLDYALVDHLSAHPQMLTEPESLNPQFYLTQSQGGAVSAADAGLNQPLPQQIIDALNLSLLAEYLETELYTRGLNTPGLIPAAFRQVFVRILLNEIAQRRIILTVLGPNAIALPTFDFTARGVLPDVFTNFNTFAGLGQTFCDNGVRAYKGQAPIVQSDRFVLTTALRFHSVEARHASEIRRIRGQKGWIIGNSRDTLPALAQGVYDGEENIVQAGLDVVVLTGYPATTVSEAFDEPLTREQVLRNVRPFIIEGFGSASAPRSNARGAASVLA